MNFRFTSTLMVMGWFLVAAPVSQAASSENPYTPIITRNVFGLVPIPVGPPPDTKPAIPPPKITPNGIMTLFGKLQALFKVTGTATPGHPAKEESYVLGVGERQDDIEVQKIDEKAAVVTFNNHGTIQELPLIAGTATGGESAPGGPGEHFGFPMPRSGNASERGDGTSPIGFGGRFGRGQGESGNPGSAAAGAPGFGGNGNSSIYSPGANSSQQPQMTPEQRIIMIEAQRQKYLEDGNPIGKLLPTTPYTPPANEASGGGSLNP